MDEQKVKDADGDPRDGETGEHAIGADTRAMDAPASGDLVGRLVDGKYRVEALIGAGGMGKVYRGRNIRTDSPVAIKTLIPDLVSDDSLVKRFEVEAKSASNLRHPNTIRIFDFGKEGTVLFMVMELLDGMSLEGLLQRQGRIAPARLIDIIRQVCRSLDEAHATGMVHRDIKPDNIFLNRVSAGSDEDHVKVLDFGVAKLKDKQYGNATLTQAGMIFGTPRYMSPEQARAFDLDGRSDIYALGVMMFECLTGLPPFTANDAVGILIKHVNEPIPPFAEVNPELEPMPELEAIVRRCMAKKPDDRFDNVRNLQNALDGVAPLYGLYGTTATSALDRGGPAETRAFEDAPNNTPSIGVSKDALDALGVKTNASRYTLGAHTDMPSGPHEATQAALPVAKIAIGLGAVVALAVVAIWIALSDGSGGAPADTPVAPAPEATQQAPGAAPAAEVEPPPPAGTNPESVSFASLLVKRALEGSVRTAADHVVTLDIRVRPETATAFATIQGTDQPPVPLPHRFHLQRAPNSPPATLKFEVTAEGFRTEVAEVDFARTERPTYVELRAAPRVGGGGGGGGGSRVSVPTRQPARTGPLDDPYQRR